MVGGGWWWLVVVGGGWWWLVAVGGGWRRLVVGDWWLNPSHRLIGGSPASGHAAADTSRSPGHDQYRIRALPLPQGAFQCRSGPDTRGVSEGVRRWGGGRPNHVASTNPPLNSEQFQNTCAQSPPPPTPPVCVPRHPFHSCADHEVQHPTVLPALQNYEFSVPALQEAPRVGGNYPYREGGDIPCGGKYESTNSGATKSVPHLKTERTKYVRFPIIAHEKQWALAMPNA